MSDMDIGGEGEGEGRIGATRTARWWLDAVTLSRSQYGTALGWSVPLLHVTPSSVRKQHGPFDVASRGRYALHSTWV
jgi:hypothetical protein